MKKIFIYKTQMSAFLSSCNLLLQRWVWKLAAEMQILDFATVYYLSLFHSFKNIFISHGDPTKYFIYILCLELLRLPWVEEKDGKLLSTFHFSHLKIGLYYHDKIKSTNVVHSNIVEDYLKMLKCVVPGLGGSSLHKLSSPQHKEHIP